MINEQEQEKQVSGGMFLEVNEIFNSIQGEGPYSGTQATFIRLAGCNLQCTWCDTEYTTRKSMSLADIEAECNQSLVIITGGEPMRQEIAPLVHLLTHRGHGVQIETNGTLWSPGIEETHATIVVSPKTIKLHPNIMVLLANREMPIYTKLIVGTNAYPSQPKGKGGNVEPVFDADYVLPLDSGNDEENKMNKTLALDYCNRHPLTKIQLQIHKILGVR